MDYEKIRPALKKLIREINEIEGVEFQPPTDICPGLLRQDNWVKLEDGTTVRICIIDNILENQQLKKVLKPESKKIKRRGVFDIKPKRKIRRRRK
jgi:hypothetical protein